MSQRYNLEIAMVTFNMRQFGVINNIKICLLLKYFTIYFLYILLKLGLGKKNQDLTNYINLKYIIFL